MLNGGLLALCLLAASPRLLADLNPQAREDFSGASVLASVGDTVFFTLNTQAGLELWAANAAEGRVWLVKDIHPGSSGSHPFFLAVLGERVVFRADDGVHGLELWTSDGTPAGTRLLRDSLPGAGGLLALNGAKVWGQSLYFLANDGVHGLEPWVTDGTPEGTRLVADTRAGSEGITDTTYHLVEFDGALYLGAYNQLWRTDGTAAGTRLIHAVDPSVGSRVVQPFVRGGQLWFSSGFSGGTTSHFHVTDGTPEGTRLVVTMTSKMSLELDLGSRVVFGSWTAGSTSYTHWLKVSDGTSEGTLPLATITSSSTLVWEHALNPSGTVRSIVVPVDAGYQLWRTDGTPEGTRLAQSLTRKGGGVGLLGDESIYVGADDLGPALFAWDGTAAPRVVRRFAALPSTILSAQVGSLFYFTASDALTGEELWVSDGTEQGTVMVSDLSAGADGTAFAALHPGAGQLLFTATPKGGALSLLRTDGSAMGVSRVATGITSSVVMTTAGMAAFTLDDAAVWLHVLPEGVPERPVTRVWMPPNQDSSPENWTVDGSFAYFGTRPAYNRIELLRTDGVGTQVLRGESFSGGSPYGRRALLGGTLVFLEGRAVRATQGAPDDAVFLSSALDMVQVGARVLIARERGSSGYELARSDGTSAGTQALQPLVGYPQGLVAAGARAYFRQPDSTSGTQQLYRATGTLEAGALVRLATFEAGLPVAYGDRVAFVANATSLASSDGTPAGTRLVPGTENTSPRDLQGLGSWVFFTAVDGARGREVWVLDGAGARGLGDFEPGAGDTKLLDATLQAGEAVLLIQTNAGRSLVRTNGTPSGTRVLGPVHGTTWLETLHGTVYLDCDPDGQVGVELCSLAANANQPTLVADYAPGIMPSSPSAPVFFGGALFVAATHPVVGREPFALDMDTTPPHIAPTVTGTLGQNGFYVGDVSLTWSVGDLESSVTDTNGCGSAAVTVDTLERVFTCSATSVGGTAVNRVSIRRDTSPPQLTCPTQVTGKSGIPVAFSVTAVDALDPAPVVVSTPPSGTVFPEGLTSVEASATDHAGHRASCQFSVLVSPAPDAGPVDAGAGGAGSGDGGPLDAGQGDSGMVDAGTGDGGPGDAGGNPPAESESCGCAGGGEQLLFGLALLMLPALSRKRRRGV